MLQILKDLKNVFLGLFKHGVTNTWSSEDAQQRVSSLNVSWGFLCQETQHKTWQQQKQMWKFTIENVKHLLAYECGGKTNKQISKNTTSRFLPKGNAETYSSSFHSFEAVSTVPGLIPRSETLWLKTVLGHWDTDVNHPVQAESCQGKKNTVSSDLHLMCILSAKDVTKIHATMTALWCRTWLWRHKMI